PGPGARPHGCRPGPPTAAAGLPGGGAGIGGEGEVEQRGGAVMAMICHVCHRDAVGQCKTCGKFYCAEHGDVYCVVCAAAVQEPGRGRRPGAEVFEHVRPEPAEEAPAPAGPRCYQCGGPAEAACGRCGRFYCLVHGGRWNYWEGKQVGWRRLCDECYNW